MTNTVEFSGVKIDEARRELCQRLATAMRKGVFRFQLRFVHRDDVIQDLWLYTYQSREWEKRDDLALAGDLASALWDEMEIVTSRNVADFGSCRRIDHSDRTDFELTFRREKVENHLAGDLESFLKGCLFYGHHDSGKDSRHRMGFRGR